MNQLDQELTKIFNLLDAIDHQIKDINTDLQQINDIKKEITFIQDNTCLRCEKYSPKGLHPDSELCETCEQERITEQEEPHPLEDR